jgi:hypothetical protein
MHPHSSSTSSSETRPGEGRRKRWRTLLWALLWLALIDAGAGFAFAFPSDVKNVNPGRLQLFFDYGRSMEGRVRRMTRADPKLTAPITMAGWYSPLTAVERPKKPGGETVTIYGMSHAVRLADALQRVSPLYNARSVGAPGAATNWAYGAFRRDTGNRRSKVVVLAIMSSTVPMITSMTPLTWNDSFPLPYTSDRFLLDGDRLKVVAPPYDSFTGYVAALEDPRKWSAAMDRVARYDPFYDPLLLRDTPLDHSTLVRMLRRAHANSRDRAAESAVLTARGFDANSEAIRLANAIASSFAADARRNGQLPVIYIVNNYGYGDQLHRALQDRLDRERIPYLSSDTVVDPFDPSNYLPDTHFTDANDDRLAEALDRLISDRLPTSAGTGRRQP